jgi:hypothetical protein
MGTLTKADPNARELLTESLPRRAGGALWA